MTRVALLFPGQGSQYMGMGRSLYDKFKTAKHTFDEANDVLGFDLKKICFEGGFVELNKMENMFPALLTASVAAFRVFIKESGIVPFCSAGHSLGEYSALTCSGVIKFSDALRIIHKRGSLATRVLDTGIGYMTVVNGVYKDIVEDECKKVSTRDKMVSIACYNSDDQVVVSGHSEALIRLEDRLLEIDANITPLLMSAPLHSPLMQEAANELKEELGRYSYERPSWPVISNVSALPCSDTCEIIKNLVVQMTCPVRWSSTMDYMEGQNVMEVVEVGPQAVLTNLVKMNNKTFKAYAFTQKEDKQEAKGQGETILSQNAPISTVIIKCMAAAVCTRNRNWNDAEFQAGVIEPYEMIEKIQADIENEATEATFDQMQRALELLKIIFDTKKVPDVEQKMRFQRIFTQTNTEKLFGEFM